ncbi:DUF2760 domain-containing protein [Pontiella sulfatireligans]|uniref:DUF2760 domain-containing protein n=1 Tax=Pontiella sulfatireligans TaxID=2750658 RepID=A0A6C2UJ83_9BACT|nr:DUF2760 domain-containing protein [Pontiella sulfatireligans]VGO20280.1 hypothetical protein SCARR_02341 [Pontiella sulfatireligans]
MNKLRLAFKAFFATLKSGAPASIEAKPETVVVKPARSEALTLLAALQREARLVDFLMEPLDGYSDQQVAAAVRDIQADSRKVLERIFSLKPLRSENEGSQITVPSGFDAGAVKLTGNVAGEAPYTGELMHPGWTAAKLDLPVWQGSDASAKIVAPAEIEI